MSDDDCDVFSILNRRAPVQEIPAEQLSLPNDSSCQEADYDIINAAETQTTSKKRGKGAKTVPKSKETTKSVNSKLPNDAALAGEVVAPRPLSPVSQLILEMEENHTKEQANQLESAPVARRTRSSLGKADTTSKTTEIPQVSNVSPPNARRRGRKPLKANAIEMTDLHVPQRSSHRRQVAELAARSQVVDSIDLVSAVMPRIEGFVNLDSDEDTPPTAVKSNIAEVDPDLDNYLIKISLSWAKYRYTKCENFKSLHTCSKKWPNGMVWVSMMWL
ncbi:DNA repair protein Rad60 isoform X2 [Drosophila tropicalis]|uniref:DNA repair protein Rad60 isoform X2 n=1 Tax=Drosophila tropicalis TaxID=46794 RepID=UPI0035ABAA44